MGLRDFLSQCARTLRISTKPGRSEIWLSIKICIIGLAAIGLIGYVIAVLGYVLNPAAPPPATG